MGASMFQENGDGKSKTIYRWKITAEYINNDKCNTTKQLNIQINFISSIIKILMILYKNEIKQHPLLIFLLQIPMTVLTHELYKKCT